MMGQQSNKARLINHLYDLSIVETYLQGGYVKLISTSKSNVNTIDTKSRNAEAIKEKNANETDFVEVQLNSDDKSVCVRKRLYVLKDVKSANIFSWSKALDNIAVRNEWKENQIRTNTLDLIEDDLVDRRKITGNVEANKRYLLTLVYSPSKLEAMLASLELVRQSSYVYIREYYDKIKRKLDVYGYIIGCHDTEIERRLNSLFWRGLGKCTKKFLINKGLSQVADILNDLERMEEQLILHYRLDDGTIDGPIGENIRDKKRKFKNKKNIDKTDIAKNCTQSEEVGRNQKKVFETRKIKPNYDDGRKPEKSQSEGSINKQVKDYSETYVMVEKENIVDVVKINLFIEDVEKERKQQFMKEVDEYVKKKNTSQDGLNGIENWERDTRGRIIIIPEKTQAFISFIHAFGGHTGMTVTYFNLKDFYNCKNIKKAIKKVIGSCKLCKRCKKQSKILKTIPIKANKPFGKVCIDIFGPIALEEKQTSSGDRKGYIFTITDVYTRYSQVYYLNRITDTNVMKSIEKWIKKFGTPDTLISDNGTQLVSSKIENYYKAKGINSIHTPIYKPASNGIAERINAIIAEIFRMHPRESVASIINKIHIRLNLNYRRSIMHSPFEKVFRHNFYDPDDKSILHFREHAPETGESRKEGRKYAENDLVYVKNFKANKTEEQYTGPYTIEKLGRKNRWVKISGMKEWVHIKDIK